MNEELLRDKVRPVTDTDRETLPVASYSKIETYKNCPFQYDLKYNKGKQTNDTSIALELGSLCHKILEEKGLMLSQSKAVDYDKLNNIIINGYTEKTEKIQEEILGTTALKKKYFEDWWEKCSATNMTYTEKMEIFDKVLHEEMEGTDWTPYLFEHQFEFVWDNRIIIHGFIDRIDKRGDELRTIDYKTSKKIYDSSKLATSLQFGIYALAILNEFGTLPVESIYRFVLLDDSQKALTLGWEKRLIKAMDKVFDAIDTNTESKIWKPSPTPLCYWCNYCASNPKAVQFQFECPYYSLWKPDNKTFNVNKEFDGNMPVNTPTTEDTSKPHKLIF